MLRQVIQQVGTKHCVLERQLAANASALAAANRTADCCVLLAATLHLACSLPVQHGYSFASKAKCDAAQTFSYVKPCY